MAHSVYFVLILFFLALYVLPKLYRLYIYFRNYVLLMKLPGPPKESIILGNLRFLASDADVIFQNLCQGAKNFYPIFKIQIAHLSAVMVFLAKDCELILSNSVHNEKGFVYDVLHNWLKFGLLTSSGKKWETRRKILTPAFHFSILQEFVSVFNKQAEQLVEALKGECNKPYVKVNSFTAEYTLRTISETAMGTKLDFKTRKERNYKKAIHDIGEILLYRVTHPWCIKEICNILFNSTFFEERKVTKTLHNFTRVMIEEKEKTFVESDLPERQHEVYRRKKRLPMLDLLISAKRHEGVIDADGIQEEVDTFLFEGHDTTATALNFILMLLANNKDAQESIYHEILEVVGNLNKKPTYFQLQNLKYMERCIKEALRLYPSVYFISRNLGQDLTTASGYFLPKGTCVIIQIYDLHRDPNIYPDPEKFDPDRFLPENAKNRHPYAYLPFSAGPRNCIGQKFAMLEMKTALCAILRHFLLEPVDTPESLVLLVDLVLRAKDEIKVNFIARH